MQSHLMSQPLRAGAGSHVFWAAAPQEKVLIFVHGFRGHPITTWQHFETLLLQDPRSHGTDIIYYGYDSAKVRAMISATQFYEFLDELFSTPDTTFSRSTVTGPARSSQFSYKKATIVAHSLGSLVCRQALLEAFRENKVWADQVQTLLFAPAHMGADIVKLATALFNFPFLGLGAALLKSYFSVLYDLEVNSQFLSALLQQTEHALQQRPCTYLTANKIFFGDKERIVSPNRFASDPKPTIYPGKDHIDVCKPGSYFLNPASEVAAAL